jgi:hypothetical protein
MTGVIAAMALPPQIAVPQKLNEKFAVNFQPFT